MEQKEPLSSRFGFSLLFRVILIVIPLAIFIIALRNMTITFPIVEYAISENQVILFKQINWASTVASFTSLLISLIYVTNKKKKITIVKIVFSSLSILMLIVSLVIIPKWDETEPHQEVNVSVPNEEINITETQ